MSEYTNNGCIAQIKYWTDALRKSQKGHRRKNKHINRLLIALEQQERLTADAHLVIDELQQHCQHLQYQLDGAIYFIEGMRIAAKNYGLTETVDRFDTFLAKLKGGE